MSSRSASAPMTAFQDLPLQMDGSLKRARRHVFLEQMVNLFQTLSSRF